MKSRRLWVILGLLCLAGAGWIVAFGGAEQTPAPAPPDWAKVEEQTIPAADAQAMKDVSQRFWDLLRAGNKDAAFALLSPATAESSWAKILYPSFQRLTAVENLSEAQLVSSSWARVSADVTFNRVDQSSGKSTQVRYPGMQLYFLVSDAQHVIHVTPDDGAAGYWQLPVVALKDFVEPWFVAREGEETPTWMQVTADKDWTRAVLQPMRTLSRQWPGWDADPEKCFDNLQAWEAAQRQRFGEFDYRVNYPLAGAHFVGMNGDSAIVEASLLFGAPTERSKVTYRFRMVQDATIQDPPEQKWHYTWRIADICVYKVENLPAEASPSPTAAP